MVLVARPVVEHPQTVLAVIAVETVIAWHRERELPFVQASSEQRVRSRVRGLAIS